MISLEHLLKLGIFRQSHFVKPEFTVVNEDFTKGVPKTNAQFFVVPINLKVCTGTLLGETDNDAMASGMFGKLFIIQSEEKPNM